MVYPLIPFQFFSILGLNFIANFWFVWLYLVKISVDKTVSEKNNLVKI